MTKAASTDATEPTPARATRASTRSATVASSTAVAKPASKAVAKPTSKAAATKKPASKTTAAKTASKVIAAKPASKPAAAKPASKAKAKPKSKRARDNSDEENAPTAKKPKAETIDEEDEEDEEEAEAEKKMVTVIKRGAAPVDPLSGMVSTHQVYANDEDVWDAMLNQTDLNKNANKFYLLQLLHPIGNAFDCILLTRWGRVGEPGAQQHKGPFPAAQAVLEFKKQFKAKTVVDWENRVGMVAKKGKYTWLERSYDDEEEEDEDSSVKPKEEEAIIPDSVLAPELQDLCNLIFNTSIADATLSSMNYDANKLPLGKLSKNTILSGFAALKELAEVIGDPSGDLSISLGGLKEACDELTGRYYSIIPHAFGRTRPPTIQNEEALKKELELVDALGDMEIATKLISGSIYKDDNENAINPLDAHFRSLQLTTMEPVTKNSKEFASLEAYTRDTHGDTHHFKAQLQNAFRVERQAETEAWMDSKFDKLADGERMLLWHGSRSTNFAGILKQGLRIAPPEAPATGYMFGKGVYFACIMSKSANYCHSYLSDNIGVLLLCEVAVKPWVEMNNANYDAADIVKKEKKLATRGVGMVQPTEWQDAGDALDNDALEGCTMPKGKCSNVNPPGAFLQYDEYIVYDPSQIRVRYLLMVKMQ